MSDPVNPNASQNGNEPVIDQKTESVDTAALEARIKALESENGKLRKANTEASADASKWKKQYQDTLSEADKAKAEQEEAAAAMQEKLDRLETNERTAILKSIGFNDETSEAIITAFKESDFEGLAEGIRKFIDIHDKDLKSNMIQNNPTIDSNGATPKLKTREEITAIKDPVARQRAIAENIELFT